MKSGYNAELRRTNSQFRLGRTRAPGTSAGTVPRLMSKLHGYKPRRESEPDIQDKRHMMESRLAYDR
jgi:hypothetical protein